MSELWAFSAVWNENDLTDDEYVTHYERLLTHFQLLKDVRTVDVLYEKKKKDGSPTKMHIHGVLEIKRGVYRKKLMMPKFHVKLVAIDNVAGWKNYMRKNERVMTLKMFNREPERKVAHSQKESTLCGTTEDISRSITPCPHDIEPPRRRMF